MKDPAERVKRREEKASCVKNEDIGVEDSDDDESDDEVSDDDSEKGEIDEVSDDSDDSDSSKEFEFEDSNKKRKSSGGVAGVRRSQCFKMNIY